MGSEMDSTSNLLTVRNSGAIQIQGSRVPAELPAGKTSIFWAIFLVVNAALGAGLLSLPYSFQLTGGIVPGILIELVMVIISCEAWNP